jgi:hypothetical protein
MIAVRVDDQMGHAPLDRIDHDVCELTQGPVRADHGAAEFQTHARSVALQLGLLETADQVNVGVSCSTTSAPR